MKKYFILTAVCALAACGGGSGGGGGGGYNVPGEILTPGQQAAAESNSYVTGMKYLLAVSAVQDNSLNIKNLVFDYTVRDYSDSLDAVVYRQIPEISEEPLLMGSPVTLYLTTDITKVPEKPEPADSLGTETGDLIF